MAVATIDYDLAPLAAEVDGAETFALEETYWGYVLRDLRPAPFRLVVGQAISWMAGAGAMIAAIGIWLAPGGAADDALVIQLGATILLASIGTLLLWFASRGSQGEIQVDTRLGEVREVTRNRAGKPVQHSCFGFDSVGGVFLDRSGQSGRLPAGHVMLVIRLGNTQHLVPVVAGPEDRLLALRDRLGRDLVVRSTPGTVELRLPQAARGRRAA